MTRPKAINRKKLVAFVFNYLKGDLSRNEKLKREQYNAKRIQTTPKHLTLNLFNIGCWRAGTICTYPPCLPKSAAGGGSQ